MITPLLIALALGLVCGAFVNTFLLRTPDGLRFTAGKRKCVTCARPMHAKDHFPLISYLVLQAKCRACKSIIPWQYPALEIVMGLLFMGFAWQILSGDAGIPFFAREHQDLFALFIRNGLVTALLLPIFMFDWRASIIPDRLSIPAMIVVLTLNFAMGADPSIMLFGGFALGSFFAIQYLVSRGTWVGGGRHPISNGNRFPPRPRTRRPSFTHRLRHRFLCWPLPHLRSSSRRTQPRPFRHLYDHRYLHFTFLRHEHFELVSGAFRVVVAYWGQVFNVAFGTFDYI